MSAIIQIDLGATRLCNCVYTGENYNESGSNLIPEDGRNIYFETLYSNAYGQFVKQPKLTVTFQTPTDLNGLCICFSESKFVRFAVAYFDTAGTQLQSAEISSDEHPFNSENGVSMEDAVSGVQRLEVTFLETGERSVVSVCGIDTDRILSITSRQIAECKIVQEIDPSGLEMPANRMSITFDAGEAVAMKKRTKFTVYDGVKLIGVFYLEQIRNLFGTRYAAELTDALGLLMKKGLKKQYFSQIFANLVYYLLHDTGVTAAAPTSLFNKVYSGILEEGTIQDQLLQLCIGVGLIGDTSGSDQLKLFTLCKELKEIPAERVYTGGTFSYADEKSGVNVTYYVVEAYIAEHEDQYEEILRLLSTDMKYYKVGISSVDYTLKNSGVSEEQGVLSLSGCGMVTEENYAEIAQRLLAYVRRTTRYTVKILWNGELPGDYIHIPAPDGRTVTGHIVRMDYVLSSKTAAEIEVLVDDVTESELQEAIAGEAIPARSVAGADAGSALSSGLEAAQDADSAGLEKRQYTDHVTVITAKNLNEIQDAIIELQNEIRNDGTVQSVNNVLPDDSGNVQLAPADVGAVDEDEELTILDVIDMWNDV